MRATNSNRNLDDLKELPIDFFEEYRVYSSEVYDIVTVGDAWFNYPIILKDINDNLSLNYKIYHIDIFKTYLGGRLMPQLSDKLNQIPNSAKLIILSLGFYDFIQLFPFENSKPNFELVNTIQESLQRLNNIGIPIIIHGYDYFIPDNKETSWISTTLNNRKIEENQLEECKRVVDAFNETIKNQINSKLSNFYYLDLRNTLSASDWYDELHPNDEGFRKLSEKFKEKIEDILNPVAKPAEGVIPKKILWVDDKPQGNVLLSEKLKSQNVSITNALDTNTGINYLQTNTYDLIITDMGRGTEREAGIDFLKKVKSLGIVTPVVFYTTKTYVTRYEKQVLELGAFAIKTGSADIISKYFLDLLNNFNTKNKTLFNNKWVLVKGSSLEPLLEIEIDVAFFLGKQLATKGFGLITGDWWGVDNEICKSFSDSLKEINENPKDRLVQIMKSDSTKDFVQYGEIVFSLDFENWNEIALRKASTMVMVGGRGGTFNTFRRAQQIGVPVISIPATGGDAKKVYNLLKDANPLVNFILESDPETIAEQIIKNLEELTPVEKKALSDSEFERIVENHYKTIKIKEADDLQKYRWGRNHKNNGKTLSAEVETSLIPGFYKVKITITDPSKTNKKAALFLHNTFKEEIRFLTFSDGIAVCDLTKVYESFTVGAYLEDGTPLELDLNDIQGFPSGFYHNDISEYFKKEVEKLYESKKTQVKDDTQKGKWGGLRESKGTMISAEVTENLIPKVFTVKLMVSSTNPQEPIAGDVAFFVDNTFSREIIYRKVKNGTANLSLTAYEAFTVGVYTQNGAMLELDLQQEEGFPKSFYYKGSTSVRIKKVLKK